MKTRKIIQTLLVLTVLFGAFGQAAAQMALPTGVSAFAYPAMNAPLTNDNPALARPIAFGDIALGGDTARVQVTIGGFAGNVDLYLALVAPALTADVLLFTPAGLVPFTGTLTPWMANLTPGPLDVTLVPDFPFAGLPPTQYQIILAATPAGAAGLNDSVIWLSDFTLGTLITVNASGSQEVPPVETAGTATANLGVNFDTGLMIGTVRFSGLSSNAVAAHFHRAPAGTNGSIFLNVLEGGLGGTSGVMNVAAGTILTADALDALRNNELYLNIHTTNNTGGEIRGQVIFPSIVPIAVALSGDQEVPAVDTPAVGTANLSLNLATRELSGTVSFSGLTSNAVAAHFHRAPAGVNAGVDLNVLQGGLGGTSGVMNVIAGTILTQDQFEAFTTNQHYINVHTTTNTGGEIRGQVIFPPGAYSIGSSTPLPPPVEVAITTQLSGAQAVPPVATAGTGTATVTFNTSTGAVSGSLTFSGLSSNAVAAHIHTGAAGTNGLVIVNMAGGNGATSGTYTFPAGSALTPAQITALQSNGLYYQVHSLTFTNGEIRGQILFP